MASPQIAVEEKKPKSRLLPMIFNRRRVRLWFKLAEMQFALNGVEDEESKFNYTAAMVSLKYVDKVGDLIVKLVENQRDDKYNYFKRKVLKRFTGSSQEDLLYGEKLEEMMLPSQYYLYLKIVARVKCDWDYIIEYWKSALPQYIREFVDTVTTNSMKDLVEMADMVRLMRHKKEMLSPSTRTMLEWKKERARRQLRGLKKIGLPSATSTPITSRMRR